MNYVSIKLCYKDINYTGQKGSRNVNKKWNGTVVSTLIVTSSHMKQSGIFESV